MYFFEQIHTYLEYKTIQVLACPISNGLLFS
jgi:hypothetical protein